MAARPKRDNHLGRRHRKALRLRDGDACYICGKPLGERTAHVHHVVPWSLGGRDTIDNLALAHPECNVAAGNLPPLLQPLAVPAGADFMTNHGSCLDCGASLAKRGPSAIRCERCALRRRCADCDAIATGGAIRCERCAPRFAAGAAERAASRARARAAEREARAAEREARAAARAAERECLDCGASLAGRGWTAKRCDLCAALALRDRKREKRERPDRRQQDRERRQRPEYKAHRRRSHLLRAAWLWFAGEAFRPIHPDGIRYRRLAMAEIRGFTTLPRDKATWARRDQRRFELHWWQYDFDYYAAVGNPPQSEPRRRIARRIAAWQERAERYAAALLADARSVELIERDDYGGLQSVRHPTP